MGWGNGSNSYYFNYVLGFKYGILVESGNITNQLAYKMVLATRSILSKSKSKNRWKWLVYANYASLYPKSMPTNMKELVNGLFHTHVQCLVSTSDCKSLLLEYPFVCFVHLIWIIRITEVYENVSFAILLCQLIQYIYLSSSYVFVLWIFYLLYTETRFISVLCKCQLWSKECAGWNRNVQWDLTLQRLTSARFSQTIWLAISGADPLGVYL